MSETQYKRIQRRIHSEVGRGAATSIWLALAFAFAGFAASLLITLQTMDRDVVSDKVEGRLQGAVAGALVAAALCMLVHFGKWMRERRKAHDICEEMDIYCHRPVEEKRSRLAFLPWVDDSAPVDKLPVGQGVTADQGEHGVAK